MKYASKTDIGQRIRNEDAFRLPQARESCPLIAVSDGMGGHSAGELASSLVIEGLSKEHSAISLSNEPSKTLEKAIQRINADIYRQAQTDVSLSGMGATLVCALLLKERFIAASVGDSRLYHFDGKTLMQITSDHSFVEMLVQKGQISREEARTHPQRNLITRAIGLALRVNIDIFERTWTEGNILLLCTDGLHGCTKDSELLEILKEDTTLEEKCETLVARAVSNDGTDNITVVLASYEEDCI